MTIIYAPTTRGDLNNIWEYNNKTYGRDHAAAYIDFLQDGIDSLATSPDQGRTVENFPDLKSLMLKRSQRGEGHVVIYRVDQAKQVIRILHIYHTSQDIQGRLTKETRR